MTDFFTVVDKVRELERVGKISEGIDLIEGSLQDRLLGLDLETRVLLCRRAAIMCRSVEDIDREYRFCQTAVRLAENDPATLYALADVYVRLGDKEKARTFFQKCYNICVSKTEGQHEQTYLKLLESRRELWEW